jgi:rhodanese-related sulfurtransferase
MKKIILVLFLLFSVSQAEIIRTYPSQKIIKEHIPIVDIRTPAEWRETGLLQGAIPITFFDEKGNYDVKKFLKELNKRVDTSKPFAIICRTGHRTSLLAPFLSKELGYTVIDLVGGVTEAKNRGLVFTPYM